jgi:hypothetical protein
MQSTYYTKFWEELIAYFPRYETGPHRKRLVQQLYCCVCIRSSVNVFTEPLPSNDRGIFTEPLPTYDRRDTHTHSNVISQAYSIFFKISFKFKY